MTHLIAPTVLALSLVVSVASARAQQPPEDPIAQHLIPPDLLMKYQREIGLDEAQREAIKKATLAAQVKFVELQWEVQAEAARLAELLQARPVDESAVLAQADRVMSLEREVKKTHLSLLVRLKNLLTETQQRRIAELRKREE